MSSALFIFEYKLKVSPAGGDLEGAGAK